MKRSKKIIIYLLLIIVAFAGIFFVTAARLSVKDEVVISPEASVSPTSDVQTVSEAETTPEALPTEEPCSAALTKCEFTYKGSTIYLLTIKDPTRVFVGSAVTSGYWGPGNGKCLDVLVDEYDALGGMNAGSFVDMNGVGQGWPPEGITYGEGVCYNASPNGELAGIDTDGKLHVGWLDNDYCVDQGITDAVSFGPVLIADGVKSDSSYLGESLYPRSAIGQKEDGSIVFMVCDGRQGYSIGLTLTDCADILYSCGCINAVNMDGGNSSAMYMCGEMINNPSNPSGGTRYLPEAWLIRKSDVESENEIQIGEVPVIETVKDTSECSACEGAVLSSLTDFAYAFIEPYINYFGTQYADYYYPLLSRCCKPGTELIRRADLSLTDRQYVSTGSNVIDNFSVNSVCECSDGSYAVQCSYTLTEYATYWQHIKDVTLVLYVEKADEAYYGYYVTDIK